MLTKVELPQGYKRLINKEKERKDVIQIIDDEGFLREISFDELTSHPTTISGYGITDAYTKAEVDSLFVTPDMITSFVNDADYNSTTKEIELKHGSTVVATVDATAFIKDGMVSSVTVENGYIVIEFNTDAGHEAIRIPITDIFDSNNYYTKAESDARYITEHQSLAGYTPKVEAIPYIEGPTTDTTAGHWTGTYEGITALEEGLTIIYVPHVAGASTTTLNINGLGAKTCYWTGTSKMTTHYPVGTPILLTYYNNGWRRADSNTTYSAGTKALFDAGANTTNRVWSAKVLADSVAPIVHTHTWSDITDGADVLSGYLPISGGELIGNLSMGGNAIINIGSLSAPSDETFSISGVRSISFAIGGAFLPLPGIVKDGNHLVFYTGYADEHDTVGEDLYHLKLTAAEEGSGEDWGGGSYKIYDESNLSLATLAGSSAIGSASQPVYYNGSALAACNLGTASQKDAVTSISSGGTGLPTAGTIYTFVNNAVTAAQPYKGVSSTAITDGGTEMPTISGYTTRTKGDVVAYNKKEFIWEGDQWRELGDEGSYALKTVQIIAGTGLAGGGAISQDVTLSLSSETIASLGLADTALQASDLDGYVNAISQGTGNYVTGITKSGKTLTITRATLPTTIALSNVTGADDLQAIEALTGTSGLLKKTAANTWTLDTNTYLTSASHKALTLKVGSITIGSDYNSLAAKTYTITKANLTDTIGTTTYAPYHADGYLPLSGGTLTGTLYTQHILPSSALGGYNIGSETAPFGSGYFSGSLLAEESVETYDVIAHGTADLSVRLAIPTSAPTSPASGKTYLWADEDGNYAETAGGGGSATVYDLTIRKNGTAIGTYNLGTQAADVNIPVGWSDLTPDASHRFLTDSLISTWNGKYTKPSTGIPKTDLARAVQTTLTNADTAYGWGNHASAGYLTSSSLDGYVNEIATGTGNYISGVSKSGKKLTFTYGTLPTTIAWGSVTGKPTTLSGYGITDAKIANGTITLGSNSITPLTSFTETDPTVPSWAKATSKPTYTLDEVSDGSTRKLSDYLPLSAGSGKKLTGGLYIDSNAIGRAAHIHFNRADWSYFETVAGGEFAFTIDGASSIIDGVTLAISSTRVYPGHTQGTISLGTSSYKWKDLYATTLYGNLDWSYIQNKPTLDNIADGTTRKLSNYLPLTGGTLTGGLTLSNVNQVFDVSTATRSIYYKASDAVSYRGIIFGTNGDLTIGYDGPSHSKSLYLDGFNEYLRFGATKQYSVKLNSTGTVELGGISAVLPVTANEVNLGSSAKAFNNIYGKLDLSYVQSASDLKAIEALTGTGLAKRTADNTWELTDTADKAEELATFSEEDAMFTYRQVPSEAVGDVLKATAVKGKSVVWNQILLANSYRRTADGITATYGANNAYQLIFSGTATSNLVIFYNRFIAFADMKQTANHKCIIVVSGAKSNWYPSLYYSSVAYRGGALNTIFTMPAAREMADTAYLALRLTSGQTYDENVYLRFHDLTAMFGSGNEPSTAAEFEALYPDYHSYNAGELVNNAASGVEMLDAGGNSLGTIPLNITGLTSGGVQIFPDGMKSAGTAYDEWSGRTATKRIGVMDLGTLSWVRRLYSNAYFFIVELPSLALRTPYNTNLLCPQYDTGKTSNLDNNVPDKTIIAAGYTSTTAGLFVRNDSYTSAATFKAAMSGVYLYYELATPIEYTTDQPLPDTLVEFDKGGTQKVIPTYDIVSGGEKVFPDGPKYINESVYDEYYDTTAIKRVGVVDLGTLTWSIRSNIFIATINDMKMVSNNTRGNILCTKYPTESWNNFPDKSIIGSYAYVHGPHIKDSSYTDAATFKAAMSGVLLYYELAEPITYTLDHTLVQAPMVCDFQYGANMSDVAKAYLPLSGGTVTGTLEAAGELIIPDSAPRNPDSTKVYLYCDTTGNYYTE